MTYQQDTYLTDHLAVSAQLWVQEFRAFWGLDSGSAPDHVEQNQWEVAKRLDELTGQVVRAAKSLERSAGDPGRVLEDYFARFQEPLTEHPLFRQALEARLAPDLEDELEAMSARAICLIDHLVSVKHERPRAYLARVGACYLRGLDTEAVVMAGAVLDAALQEEFDDNAIRQAGIRCGRYVSLGNRIEYAIKMGRLTEEEGEKAFLVAHERNKAVHAAPGTSADPEDILQELAGVLSALM